MNAVTRPAVGLNEGVHSNTDPDGPRLVESADPEALDAVADALAADLAAAGYTADRVRDAWGDAADGALGRGSALPAMRAIQRGGSSNDPADAGALATLAAFFGLGAPVAADALARALPTTPLADLEALGLARAEPGAGSGTEARTVTPGLLIRPQGFVDDDGAGDWWIASDLDESALRLRGLPGALPVDHVLGAGGASLTLAGLHLPTPARRVLDVGAGCGIQALRARRYADAVTATDISPRALAMTRLNARLISGIDTRRGSLFEPVAGERFDRVVSNPPFVITPRGGDVPAYEYRDGGLEGDDLVRSVIEGVGDVLEPGGVAQLLGNWEGRGGVDGLDRVREWVDASPVPLDAWVIERERADPAAYAELWIRDGGTVPGTPAYDRLLAAWLDDFEARGVTDIGFGYVLLRRATGRPTLRRFERLAGPVAEAGLGAALAAGLAAHDALEALDDDALAATTFRVAPDVTETRHQLPGADAPSVIELRQGAGFLRTIAVDPALAGIVGACDGDLPLGVLVDAVAQLLDADASALRTDVLPRVRELTIAGILRLP